MKTPAGSQGRARTPMPGLIRSHVIESYNAKAHSAQIGKMLAFAKANKKPISELRARGVSDEFVLRYVLENEYMGNKKDILRLWPKLKPLNLKPHKIEVILSNPGIASTVEDAIDQMRQNKMPIVAISNIIGGYMAGRTRLYDTDGLRAFVNISFKGSHRLPWEH